jgi:peptidoglycan hydrolase-like protein with peptidoglycan-binding domain
MIIRRGDSGNGVAIVQHALNHVTRLIPKLKPDGIFGPVTEQRVIQHQTQQNLRPDGIVGPVTLDSLFEIVKMQGTATFRRVRTASRPAVGVASRPFGLRNLPPPPPNLMTPAMAEMIRQQQAFWQWFTQPVPKPALPIQAVIVPVPGPFGPVFLPVAHQQIDAIGPPMQRRAKVQFASSAEGGAFTLSIKGEATADVAKMKFKDANYSLGLDWAVFKGRAAEFTVGSTVQRGNDGQLEVEAEASITGGSGLTLKTKLGQLGVVKLLPYLAAAVSSEMSLQASTGGKAAVEINLSPGGGTKVVLTGKAGPKAIFGPVTLPDGREHHQFTLLPFAAAVSLALEGEFDFP